MYNVSLNCNTIRAKEAAKLEAHKQWGKTYGSPLLQARIADGFEWAKLADDEFCWAVVVALYIGRQPVTEHGSICRADEPSLAEILELRAMQKRIKEADLLVRASLVRVKYSQPLADDGLYEDEYAVDRPEVRTELMLEITTPRGVTYSNRYLLAESLMDQYYAEVASNFRAMCARQS